MSAHADFAPSSAQRVWDCPASWALNRAMPDRESRYSAEGTFAHHIADKALRLGVDADAFEGETGTAVIDGVTVEFTCDGKMIAALQDHIDLCRELPGDWFTERKVDISNWTPLPKQFGTSDFAACRTGHLDIVDLKYGEGVQVWAEGNKQGVEYALGFIDEFNWAYDFESVSIHIHQPRLDHFDVWHTDVATVRRLGAEIKAKYIVAMGPNPPFGPTEKACQFCKVSATCPALQQKINSDAALVYDDIEGFTPDVELLTLDQLVQAWNTRKLYDIRFNAIETLIDRKLLSGAQVPGLKLVEGRTHSRWRSREDGIEAMCNAGIPESQQEKRTLLSPAQAKKKVSAAQRKVIAEAVVKPRGKPTIVRSDDPRPGWDSRAADVFIDLDEEEEIEL